MRYFIVAEFLRRKMNSELLQPVQLKKADLMLTKAAGILAVRLR